MKMLLMVALFGTTVYILIWLKFFSNKNKSSMNSNLDQTVSNFRIQNDSSVPRIESQNVNLTSKLQNNSLILNPSTIKVKISVPIVGSREKKMSNQTIELCPVIPPNLKGRNKVKLDNIPSLATQEKMFVDLYPGGKFKPKECQARNKVAIIIPYRNRQTQLPVFLYHIHPFLQRQQLDYGIFVIEQADSMKFNRGMLLNVGSIEALKLYPYICYMLHDVDLLPEDDRNLYTCPEQPRHMAVAIDQYNYRIEYDEYFGGVTALTTAQFHKVNGFSNKFWGWGSEDDDLYNRVQFHGFNITRYPANIARYTMIRHKKESPNPVRMKLYKSGRSRFHVDGLNSITYKILKLELRPLYTWVKVELIKV